MMPPALLAKARLVFEKRVKDQIERHRSVDPSASTRQIVELTFRLENERLKSELGRLIEAEELSAEDEIRIMSLRYIINELLPELERSFKTG